MLEGIVTGLYTAKEAGQFVTTRESSLSVDIGGIPGDRHYGVTKYSGVRERAYTLGTLIRNNRQISLVSEEELQMIAAKIGIPSLPPEWLVPMC